MKKQKTTSKNKQAKRSGRAVAAGGAQRAGSDSARVKRSAQRAARSGSHAGQGAQRAVCGDHADRAAQVGNAAQAARSDRGSACDLCAVFGRCGGCSLLDVPYKRQLADKQRATEELFAGLAEVHALRPILGMDDPFRYRNKVISPYAPGRALAGAARGGKRRDNRGGKRDAASGASAGSAPDNAPRREVLTGMYAKGTHKLVPTDACMLENETAKRVTLAVRDLMRKWGIAPYDEDAGAGFMRHAVVRVGHTSGEVLVTLVTNADEFPSSKSFCRELVRRVPAVTTVVQNVNLRQTNVILGEKERTLYGPGFILDTLCGLSFRISSHSFYQVNVTQTEVLYNAAIDLAQLSGTEGVIDAYCGTGTIGLVAAARGAACVTGVDNVPSAIRDAQQNARHNRIENARFVTADATEFMRGAARAGERVDVLLMDPPRAGSTEAFLDAAASMAPERIVYISCNPKTQARDAAYLRERGYRIDAVQPVDMFPHTDHVECICRFVREQER